MLSNEGASYFTQHGQYEIYDYYTAIEKGKIPEDYYVWWGFEDSKLYEYAKEEREHAYKILDFLDEWNHSTTLGPIKEVITDFKDPKNVFEIAYQHEQAVTKSILDIMTLARNKKDNTGIQFLDWFIEEQREEEDKMLSRFNRLRLADNNMAAILFLDKEDGLA